MAKICISISDKTASNLKEFSEKNKKSVSSIVEEMIEEGLSLYDNNQKIFSLNNSKDFQENTTKTLETLTKNVEKILIFYL